MDIESPHWDAWEAQFRALADQVPLVPHTPDINGAQHYLCLYGENGLSPEDELAELAVMAAQQGLVKRVEVDTDYWQDIVLFIV